MSRIFAALLMLLPVSGMADGLSCKDAAAFYNYAMFTGKAVGAVSGACAKDINQTSCAAFLKVFEEDGDKISKAVEGDATAHLNYLKEQCPNDFPDNPGKF